MLLEELAVDLAGDPTLRVLSPMVAAALFLDPVTKLDKAAEPAGGGG